MWGEPAFIAFWRTGRIPAKRSPWENLRRLCQQIYPECSGPRLTASVSPNTFMNFLFRDLPCQQVNLIKI